MSSHLPPQTIPGQVSPHAASLPIRLWHDPSITIARMALRSYLRSGWLWGECVYVLLVYAAFFATYAVSMGTFFGVANFSLWILAIVGTVILARRAMSARAYLHLAKLPSRAAYVRGLMLAPGVLRIPLFLLLLLVTLGTGKILQPAIGPLLGVVMNCLVISALAVALCPSIATRIKHIGFLAWPVAALYSYGSGPLAGALAVLRVPLLPLATSFNFSTRGTLGWPGLLALIVEAIYIAGFMWLAAARLARRDLVLH